MTPSQRLSAPFGKILPQIDDLIRHRVAVLAQGDTATVRAAALAAFQARVPFGHVEAGLRSGALAAPFPEEGNRRLVGVVTGWHLAPTETAADALRRERTAEQNIHVVGNSVIDALLGLAGRTTASRPTRSSAACPTCASSLPSSIQGW